jgi:hypothetical protein
MYKSNFQSSLFSKTTTWIITLAIISLFTPFVYMKIGPKGIEYYGKNVPDIYILGGYILGKDTSFWGINFAYKFQFFCILVFISTTYMFEKFRKTSFLISNLFLLTCFPFWLEIYSSGVKNNSDAADLTIVYPIVGIILWAVLLLLNVIVFIKHLRSKQKDNYVSN